MTYAEKLRSPEWQKKRLEILERDGWSCKLCGCKEKTLHVHHRMYERAKMPWEYSDDVFLTLCENCHQQWHQIQSEVDRALCDIWAENFEKLKNLHRVDLKRALANMLIDSAISDSFNFGYELAEQSIRHAENE